MANGFASLDEWIRDLRATRGIGARMASELAPIVKRETDAGIAAGHGLDGVPWRPTKAGTPPLKHAAKAVSVKGIGNTILLTLTGHEVFHQFGAGRLPIRAILPLKGLPFRLGDAIRKGIVDAGPPFMDRKGGHR